MTANVYFEVNDEVAEFEAVEEIVEVFETGDFPMAGDRIGASLGTEEGQLLVCLSPGVWMVIAAPTADNLVLMSDLDIPGKFKLGVMPTAGTFPAVNADAVDLEVGDVVIWDNTYTATDDFGVKRTADIGDRRVCGVVAEIIVPGAIGEIQYGGLGQVKVKGNGTKGAALRTSNTAGRAEANGGSKQNGFVGFAQQDWTGNSTIGVRIEPDNFRYGARVVILGSATVNNAGGTVALDVGSGDGRLILAFTGNWNANTGFTLTGPKVAGNAMTALAAEQSGWGNGSEAQVHSNGYKYDPSALSGVQTLTGGTGGSKGLTLFLVLQSVNAIPLGTCNPAIVTSSGPSVACLDAVVGDLVIACLIKCDSAGATLAEILDYGTGETMIVNVVGASNTGYGSMVQKDATTALETCSWSLSVNEKEVLFIVPVRPA